MAHINIRYAHELTYERDITQTHTLPSTAPILFLSHDTHINESRHASEWAIAHIRLRYVHELTSEWDLHTNSHIAIHSTVLGFLSHDKHTNQSRHTSEWVVAHTRIRHPYPLTHCKTPKKIYLNDTHNNWVTAHTKWDTLTISDTYQRHQLCESSSLPCLHYIWPTSISDTHTNSRTNEILHKLTRAKAQVCHAYIICMSHGTHRLLVYTHMWCVPWLMHDSSTCVPWLTYVHTDVCHDSCTCTLICDVCHDSRICTHVCVLWLMYMYTHMQCVPWLMHMYTRVCAMTHVHVYSHAMCAMTHV